MEPKAAETKAVASDSKQHGEPSPSKADPRTAASGAQSAKFPLPRMPTAAKLGAAGPAKVVLFDIVEVTGADKHAGVRGTVLAEIFGDWDVMLDTGVRTKFKPAHLKKLDKPMVHVGDTLRVKTNNGERTGIVRFLGTTAFADGEWLGLELPTDNGKNDGSVKGHSYFQCAPNHGLFVQHIAILEHTKAAPQAQAGVEPPVVSAHADIRAKLALLGNLGGKPVLPQPPAAAAATATTAAAAPAAAAAAAAATTAPTTESPAEEGVPAAAEAEEVPVELVHAKKAKAVGGRRPATKVAFQG